MLLYGAGALGTTLLTPLSGGALRIGDWVAHWFLVLVYLGQPLPDLRVFTNRVGDFGVISRPPLYNLEGGVLVGVLGDAFWPFQLITPLLALAVPAAAVLWARALGGERATWVAAPLAGLSPFLVQNASYPWSKMVAGGLVLLFLLMIRAAVLARRPDRARHAFVLAALCAGLGYLAHQTTIFYVLPTLVWLAWRRPRPLLGRSARWTLLTWALGGLAGLAAVLPWQGWVLATHGLRETLEASPAWFGADVSETFADWLVKGLVAAVGTLVPLPLLGAFARGALPTLDQLLRVQLALLTGALGISGCWLLWQGARGQGPGVRSQEPGVRSQESGARGDHSAYVQDPSRLPLARTREMMSATRGSGEAEGPRVRWTPIVASRSEAGGEGHSAGGEGLPPGVAGGEGRLVRLLLRRPPWLALVVLAGFFGQVMLQPNWHDTGDAAESMTPIVVLALALVAREATRLGRTGRRVFVGLVLAELGVYLALWLGWAFSSAWTRDPNAVLASRYGLAHLRTLWWPAVPLGALLLAGGVGVSTALLWRALFPRRQTAVNSGASASPSASPGTARC